jgi:hypothetical protein
MRRTAVALVLPAAGAVALTTEADATPASGLAVDRFPVNGNGEYDMAAGPGELDTTLPQEATAPASCGIIEGSNISTIPAGVVDTGVGPLPAQATGPSPAHRCSRSRRSSGSARCGWLAWVCAGSGPLSGEVAMADRSSARVDPVAGRMCSSRGGTHRERDGSEGHRGALGPVHHGVPADTREHRSGAAVARPDRARRPAGEQAGASRDPCVGCGAAHHRVGAGC